MDKDQQKKKPEPVEDSGEWGHIPGDEFGYESKEERRAKRGLEDWEMVNAPSTLQRNVPVWFIAVVAVVLLVAIGLSFPFWGDRPGYEREWINWGFFLALIYATLGSAFVYIMVHFYGSRVAKRLGLDPQKIAEDAAKKETPDDSEKKI